MTQVKKPPASVGDTGSIPGLRRSPEEENGNPLQRSCLGHSVDRGAGWPAVHGVTKSWTLLSVQTLRKLSAFSAEQLLALHRVKAFDGAWCASPPKQAAFRCSHCGCTWTVWLLLANRVHRQWMSRCLHFLSYNAAVLRLVYATHTKPKSPCAWC